MMKRLHVVVSTVVLLLLVSLFGIKNGYGQLRSGKGIKRIEVSTMLGEHGNAYTGGFSMFLSSTVSLEGELFYEDVTSDQYNESVTTYGLVLNGNKILIGFKSIFYVSAQLGVTSTYDRLVFRELDETDNGVNIGAIGGIELECYITDRVILWVNNNRRYYFKEKLGGWRNYVQLGIKYKL